MTVLVNFTNMTGLADVPAAANTATNGGFWVTVLYMIFVVFFLISLAAGFEIALIVASFPCLLLSLLMAFQTPALVDWSHSLVFLALLLLSFLYISWTRGSNVPR